LVFTVLIPARNAESTLRRCLASLSCPLVEKGLLIDDFSDDGTVEVARNVLGSSLRVVRPERHINVPFARNAGLDAVETDWLVWCDADDCFELGRVEALAEAISNTDADCASDGVRLFDGVTDQFLRDLPMPGFMKRPEHACRIFERNYLPAVGHIAVRTALAREVRYDPAQSGGDDYDFALRLIRAGARFAFSPNLGYRMYAYPGSDSRRLPRQNQMVGYALRKHRYEDVASLYSAAGFNERVTAWGLCSMAVFRGDYQAATGYLNRAFPSGSDPTEVLEPEGPYPVPEGWRAEFFRGTLSLLLKEAPSSLAYLRKAMEILPTADTANNLGVALAATGGTAEARSLFERALELFPGYLDARLNLASESPHRITPLPLRLQPSRSDYQPESA